MNSFTRAASRVACATVLALGATAAAQAGSIVLTGHDSLLHGGQNNFDDTVMDYLRGLGTSGGIARADYDIAFLTNGGVTNPTTRWLGAGWGSVSTASPTSFADAAAFEGFLAGKDILVIPWRIDIGAAGSAAINGFASVIEDFFNTGGDIYANSSRDVDASTPGPVDPAFYDFLPPGSAASGDPLPGDPSSGFVTTAAGAAIGLTPSMINGFATHNVFSTFDSDFTVLETFGTGGPVITLGIQDATITGGGITTGTVPEPATLLLFGAGALGLAGWRRRRA